MTCPRRLGARALAWAVLLAWAPSASIRAQEVGLAGLEAGPHAVGFRVHQEYDAARTLGVRPRNGVERRPVQISLWYPSSRAQEQSLRFGDYVAWTAREVDFAPVSAEMLDRLHSTYATSSPVYEGASPDSLRALFDCPMAASLDAEPAAGPFPLLLTNGSADLQPGLFEYLASHGFVVASVPALGAEGPRRGPPSVADYEACARDMEFALAHVEPLAFVDSERVALIGFGGGGLFALPVLLRNGRIDALVSFEAGLFMPAFLPTLERVPGVDFAHFDAPLLHFLRDELSMEESPERLELAPEGKTHFVYLHAPELHHHDLSQAGILSTEVLGLRPALRDDVRSAYRLRATATLLFLRAYLRTDAEAAARLEVLEDEASLAAGDFTHVHL